MKPRLDAAAALLGGTVGGSPPAMDGDASTAKTTRCDRTDPRTSTSRTVSPQQDIVDRRRHYSSRTASWSAPPTAPYRYYHSRSVVLLPGILEHADVLELHVAKLAIDLFDAPDIDGLDDVAGLGVDRDRAAGAGAREPLQDRERLVGAHPAAELVRNRVDRRHAVVARHRHEVRRAGRGAIGIEVRLEERLVLGRVVRDRVVVRRHDA